MIISEEQQKKVENDISKKEEKFLRETTIIEKYFDDRVGKHYWARECRPVRENLTTKQHQLIQKSLTMRLDHAKEILISRYPRLKEYTMECYLDWWEIINNCTTDDLREAAHILEMYEKREAKERKERSFWRKLWDCLFS